MAALTGWKLKIKQEYNIPVMFFKRMLLECKTEEQCLNYIAKTTHSL